MEVGTIQVHFTINPATAPKPAQFNVPGVVQGDTLYQVMLKAVDASLMTFEAVTFSGLGHFVTTIDGRKADDDKHESWKLSANGQDLQVGVDLYVPSNGDNIAFNFITAQ